MKVLIIEDEPLAAARLERLIVKAAPDFNIVGKTESITESVAFLNAQKVDVIFADIHLSDGHSFSIFETVDIEVPIIFTTAYDQYAVKAFQWNSIDYLLKPIEKEALKTSIEKLKKVQMPVSSVDIEALTAALNNKEPRYKSRLLVQIGDKLKTIAIANIAYFKGEGKYVYLFTNEGNKYIVDYTLTDLESLLKPDDFFRVNRQFIIAFPAIKNMYAASKGRVSLELLPATPEPVIVSTERSPNFKIWLNA